MIQARTKESYKKNVGRPAKEKLGQKSAPINKTKSRDELAKIAGVSHDTIEKVFIVFTK